MSIYASGLSSLTRKPSSHQKGFLRVGAVAASDIETTSATTSAPTSFSMPEISPVWKIAATASFVASVYHGYKRNDSVGWAIWWGVMGALFPVITPVIGVAQGFGKRAIK